MTAALSKTFLLYRRRFDSGQSRAELSLTNPSHPQRAIAQGAALRDESRGAHYKPDFPDRDDKNFLKTTKAYFAPDADEPRFEFEPVDISLLPPRPRRYDMAK